MQIRHAKLNLRPGHSVVEIDGHDVAACVHDLDLNAGVNEIPRLTLDLLMHEVEVDGEMTVVVPDSTRETLTALGWTPPEESLTDPQGETHDDAADR